jgi:hypothetical protein
MLPIMSIKQNVSNHVKQLALAAAGRSSARGPIPVIQGASAFSGSARWHSVERQRKTVTLYATFCKTSLSHAPSPPPPPPPPLWPQPLKTLQRCNAACKAPSCGELLLPPATQVKQLLLLPLRLLLQPSPGHG